MANLNLPADSFNTKPARSASGADASNPGADKTQQRFSDTQTQTEKLLSKTSDLNTIPQNSTEARAASQQSQNYDALKTGNPNQDQVTIKTKNGSETYATQNDGKSTTYTDKQGNQYTGKEGTNGQIELTPKDKNVEPVSGQVANRGEDAAFNNKNNNNQADSSEPRTTNTKSTTADGQVGQAYGKDTSASTKESANNPEQANQQIDKPIAQESPTSASQNNSEKSSGGVLDQKSGNADHNQATPKASSGSMDTLPTKQPDPTAAEKPINKIPDAQQESINKTASTNANQVTQSESTKAAQAPVAPGKGETGTTKENTQATPAQGEKSAAAGAASTTDTTRTKPVESPAASSPSGKVEPGSEKATAQLQDKSSTTVDKTSPPPLSQKETRKDLYDTMKAIDGNKLESLPAKDQKFVASLEAMKQNEPDKYNQLKDLLGKEFDATKGGTGKGDQASYLGQLNTLLGLDKTSTILKGGVADSGILAGFLNANREILLRTTGNDAQQKVALTSLNAILQEFNKPLQNPIRTQDILTAMQNQSSGQQGSLDQLLSASKDSINAASSGRSDAAAVAGATKVSTDASSQSPSGRGQGPGQDGATFTPMGTGTGKPGDGTTSGTIGSDSRTALPETKTGGKEDVSGKILKSDEIVNKLDPAATKVGSPLTAKIPQTGKTMDPNMPQDGTVKPQHPSGQLGGGRQQIDPYDVGTILSDKGEKDKDENEEKQEKQAKKPEPEQRQRYIVQLGDTLESIASKKLGNSGLAPLIFEINANVISSWKRNGKTVVDLKPKLVIYLPTTVDIQEYNSRPFNGGQQFEYAGNEFKTPEEELAMWENQIRGPANNLPAEIVNKTGFNNQNSTDAAIGGNLTNIGEQPAEAAAAFKIRRSNVEKMLGPLSSAKPEAGGRIKYTVRLGDTLRSIALKHPALQDVKLWKVLAQANNLPITTDAKGVPTTVISRGMTLLIPSIAEIEEFRQIQNIDRGNLLPGSKPATTAAVFDIVTKPCPECDSIVRSSDTICPKCGHSFAAEALTFAKEPLALPHANVEKKPIAKPEIEQEADTASKRTPAKAADATTGSDKRKSRTPRGVKAITSAGGSPTNISPAANVPPAVSNTKSFAYPAEIRAKSTDSEDEEDPTTTILRAAGMLPANDKKVTPPALFEVTPSRSEKHDPGAAPTLFEAVPTLRSRRKPAEPALAADTSQAASANAFIKQMSQTCRLVKSHNELYGLKEGDKLCLEINHEENWVPVVIYEIHDQTSKRHEFRLDGKQRTTRIDLPPFAVQELADNDLSANWENYFTRYIAGKSPSD